MESRRGRRGSTRRGVPTHPCQTLTRLLPEKPSACPPGPVSRPPGWLWLSHQSVLPITCTPSPCPLLHNIGRDYNPETSELCLLNIRLPRWIWAAQMYRCQRLLCLSCAGHAALGKALDSLSLSGLTCTHPGGGRRIRQDADEEECDKERRFFGGHDPAVPLTSSTTRLPHL